MNYNSIKSLELECTCVSASRFRVERLMRGAVRADKRKINRLVRVLLPDLYEELALQYHNPYSYYRTETHLILVWSGIEHFLKIRYGENR